MTYFPNALKVGTYSDQSANGLDTPRRPSTTRPTLVTWSANIACNANEDGRIRILQDSAATPTTVLDTRRVKTASLATDCENTVGGSFIVPANEYYEIETTALTGTPTFTLVSLQEVTL